MRYAYTIYLEQGTIIVDYPVSRIEEQEISDQ
jgi:hypothetical protein